ncbi:MAG: hypothetical protein H0W73_15325 [Bacteroidetes bacterium]|nr:hypothetical protein [Bacteroidota bacterium]
MFQINKLYKIITLSIVMQLILTPLYSQKVIDSLVTITKSNTHDTVKFGAYNSGQP